MNRNFHILSLIHGWHVDLAVLRQRSQSFCGTTQFSTSSRRNTVDCLIDSIVKMNYCNAAFSFCKSIPHISGGSRLSVWGGQWNRGAKKVFTYLNTKGLRQSLGIAQKWLPFVGQTVVIFLGRTIAIFQGITTVWKRFKSLIQKTFETGLKQWASFFTS